MPTLVDPGKFAVPNTWMPSGSAPAGGLSTAFKAGVAFPNQLKPIGGQTINNLGVTIATTGNLYSFSAFVQMPLDRCLDCRPHSKISLKLTTLVTVTFLIIQQGDLMLRRFIPFLMAILVSPAIMPAQSVTVTASRVFDSAGNLASGVMTFSPTLADGAAAAYRNGLGGKVVSTPVSVVVKDGAFSITLPDTSLTNPANICFAAALTTIKGPGTGRDYTCLQPHAKASGPGDWCQAGICNFDNYVPNLAPLAFVVAGSVGPPGATGRIGLQGATLRTGEAGQNIHDTVAARPTLSTVNAGSVDAAEALLPSGGTLLVNNILTVASNHNTPANITLEVKRGGGFNIAAWAVLNLKSPIDAGRNQIFSGAGIVSVVSNTHLREIYPEWWGADPTGILPSAVAWQSAINAATNVNTFGGTVSCPNAVYNIENTLYVYGTDTAKGVSLLGPEGQNNNALGACALKYTGPAGGTLLHYLSGHMAIIKNMNFHANSLASRAIWFDSANTAAFGMAAISSIVRSCQTGTTCPAGQGNIITATMATTPGAGWPAGADVTLAGVPDPSFNGIFPVLSKTDATHYIFSQGGRLASSSGGTGTTGGVPADPDDSAHTISNINVWGFKSQVSNMSSCSIAAGALSCTLTSPIVMYPNQWIRISGSTDPTYNAYWKLTDVSNGGLSFAAVANQVTSEAGTTSGVVQGPSAGITFGSNQLALMPNSVCCMVLNRVSANGGGISPAPLFGYLYEGWANVKDQNLYNIGAASVRVGFGLGQINGNWDCQNCGGTSISDALFLSTGFAVIHIHDSEWEQVTGAYIYASMASGSYLAKTLGTAGQFEVNSGYPRISITGMNFENWDWAPDGVAISTGGSLYLEGNIFGYGGSSAQYMTAITAATTGSGQTPGNYVLTGTGSFSVGGRPAIINVTVGGRGTVTTAPIIHDTGKGYSTPPSFTLAAGGTPATFTPVLGYPVPWINTYTGYSQLPQNSYYALTSIHNLYTYVSPGSFIPAISKNGSNISAYGPGSLLGGAPITSINDHGSDSLGHSFHLNPATSLNVLKYVAPATGNPLDDAALGFIQLPNNIQGMCWRNFADSLIQADDCITANAKDLPQWSSPAGTGIIPTLGGDGSLIVSGSLGNAVGSFAHNVSNLLPYSQFDAGSPWVVPFNTMCANTITPNAMLDPAGMAATVEQFETAAGCVSTGQKQALTLTAGTTYTFSVWAKGLAGGEIIRFYIGYVSGCSTGFIPLTTVWQQYSATCTPTSTGPQDIIWATTTPSATIYVDWASVVTSTTRGFYVHTTNAPIVSASGLLLNGNFIPSSPSVAQLSGTTGSIGGAALVAGACASGTATVTGITNAMVVRATPVTYPGDGIWWDSYVSAANVATVKVCASVALTPVASAYNVRVLQ